MNKDKLKKAVSSLYGSMSVAENDKLATQDDQEKKYQGKETDLKLDLIEANPNQPRNIIKDGGGIDPQSIEELSKSIKEFGVLEPILVRPLSENKYQIIAGERRHRAALSAGLTSIPAIIMDISEEKAFELALIENIQREDLNPIALGKCFLHLLDKNICKSMDEVSERVGISKTRVHQLISLLKLPHRIQSMISSSGNSEGEKLSEGHARQLLRLTDEEQQHTITQKIVMQGLSVRQTEQLVIRLLEDRPEKQTSSSYQSFPTVSSYIKAKVSPDGERVEIKFQYKKAQGRESLLEEVKNFLESFDKGAI